MLSNNHTSDQIYKVKLEFFCWISEFLLHISTTTNKDFLCLILIVLWQMFEFGMCFFLYWQLWTFRLWKFEKKISNYSFRPGIFLVCHSTTWQTSLYCVLPLYLHCSYLQYCTRTHTHTHTLLITRGIFNFFYLFISGGGAVGWGTALQFGSRGLNPYHVIIFFINIIFLATLWPRNGYKEYLLGHKSGPWLRLTNVTTFMYRLSWNPNACPGLYSYSFTFFFSIYSPILFTS
jgi:hypothetical protein